MLQRAADEASSWLPDVSGTGTPVPEDDVIQVERVLNDARGGYSDPQNVLLGGHISWGSQAF